VMNKLYYQGVIDIETHKCSVEFDTNEVHCYIKWLTLLLYTRNHTPILSQDHKRIYQSYLD